MDKPSTMIETPAASTAVPLDRTDEGHSVNIGDKNPMFETYTLSERIELTIEIEFQLGSGGEEREVVIYQYVHPYCKITVVGICVAPEGDYWHRLASWNNTNDPVPRAHVTFPPPPDDPNSIPGPIRPDPRFTPAKYLVTAWRRSGDLWLQKQVTGRSITPDRSSAVVSYGNYGEGPHVFVKWRPGIRPKGW